MLATREAAANVLFHQDFSIKGTGWDKIAISCEMFHLPAPKMDLYESNTRVTLFAEIPYSNLSADDRGAVEAKFIKPLDPETAPRYMKYIPMWA